MIALNFFQFIFWYVLTSLFSFVLIMFREDAPFLYKDIKDSFDDGFFYGVSFIMAYIFYAPMTLPYSINYFFKKWMN